MFFQISPVRKIEKKPVKNNKKESEEVTELSLAPFSANSKLAFEDIKVGSVASRKLLIKNPNAYDIELNITHNFPEEMNIILTWNQHVAKADTETLLEITWCPQCEGSWRYILNVEGTRHIHKSVPVALKSFVPKETKTNSKGRKAKITKKLSPKHIPIKKRNVMKSPMKKVSVPRASDLPSITISTPSQRTRFSEKENMNVSRTSPVFLSPSRVSFRFEMKNTVERRETYTLQTTSHYVPKVLSSSTKHNISPDLNKERRDTYLVQHKRTEATETVFDDSLEMTSPNETTTKVGQNKVTFLQTPKIPDNIFSSQQFSPLCFAPLPTLQVRNDNFDSYVIREISPRNTEFPDGIESPSILFANKNSTFRMDNSSPLGDISTATYTKGNISTETYTKGNVSAETYVKENSSSETYTKANVSTSTYVKDSSVGDLANLTISPLSSKTQDVAPSRSYFIEPHRLSPHFERKLFPNDRCFKDNFDTAPCTFQNRNKLGSITEESFRTDCCDNEKNTSHRKTLKRRSSPIVNNVSPKRSNIDSNKKKRESNLSWSKKVTSLRVAKKTSGLQLQHNMNNLTKDGTKKEVMVTVKDTHQINIDNPFILAATSTIDPFMTSSLYFDEAWVEEQEKNFKKWLNALLTPPEELNTNVEGPAVNVAKLWQQCRKIEVAEAPTKETVSEKYHTEARLNSLRKLARSFFMTTEISDVLTKVNFAVENEKLIIRRDRDIHRDLNLQSEIMSLFLSYNPLWLRIGLETIYNVVIPLSSNSDVMGLSRFIMERFFKDPHLLKKYLSVHSPKYTDHLKKFMLKKFLILVYFLDQAKTRKLLPHDPCLFCKNAPIKESREILFNFAKNALFAVGDITKYLKLLGYVVVHKQTYIHEYNYAVKNLGADLRDGVRLTRVMEIILLRDELIDKLRVPPISRLQKVHNTKVAFDSLVDAGCKIMHDIEPKDLVDGHREKTLSFLWQLIYKFEAPLMVKSVTTIQKWWRSFGIQLKRDKLRKARKEKETAVLRIQKWYRRQKLASNLILFRQWVVAYLEEQRRQTAAVKIQSYFRMYVARREYINLKCMVIKIQAYARRWLFHNYYNGRIKAAIKIQSYVRMYLKRKEFLKMKYAVLAIEAHYIAHKQMKIEKERYDKLRYSVLLVQSIYRANVLMRRAREAFVTLKKATLVIQRRYRAKKAMLYAREEYCKIRYAAITIQAWYRATKIMRECRIYYKKQKHSVQIIEQKYLAKKLMRTEVEKYQQLRRSVIVCQQRFRAQVGMKIQNKYYMKLKQATVTIQRRYRAKVMARIERNNFIQLRKSVIICQNRFRANQAMKLQRNDFIKLKLATLVIQRRYRANKIMKIQLQEYTLMKYSVVKIQRYYRAWVKMRDERNYYCLLKEKTVQVQKLYRAKLAMKAAKADYNKLKSAVTYIQRKYRAYKKMKADQNMFRNLRAAVITVQRHFRANILMKKERKIYINLRRATLYVQQRFRAIKLMKQQRLEYLSLRKYTIVIQQRFRARRAMIYQRNCYLKIKKAAIVLQQRYRAKVAMQSARHDYLLMKKCVINIQRRFRANFEMKREYKRYNELRRATVVIQRRYRVNKLMKLERNCFHSLKKSALIVQQRYRALRIMRQERKKYCSIRLSAITIQNHFRAWNAGRTCRIYYQQLCKATLFIQRRFRANRKMKLQRQEYMKSKYAANIIQARWRATLLMRKAQSEYVLLKYIAIKVQQRFRANNLMKQSLRYYLSLKHFTLIMQRRFRAKQLMKRDRAAFLKLKESAILIQKHFRNQRITKIHQSKFLRLRKYVIMVQQRYRALRAMKNCRSNYLNLKKKAVYIQRWWRCHRARHEFLKLKHSVLFIQRKYRALLVMRQERRRYLHIRKSAIVIQRYFRNYSKMKQERDAFIKKKTATVTIQRYVRGFLTRRKYSQLLSDEAKEERRKLRKQSAAATKIQALWRGYKSRSVEDPELEEIRHRSKEAQSKALPENTLGQRCKQAVHLLVNENITLLQVLKVLEDLEYITRRCRTSCIQLSKSLSEYLYMMICSTSRSLPEMNACNLATHILINFCKYKVTSKYSWVPEYVDKIVTVMLHWCDKESLLFASLCTLLWLFAHNEEYKVVIRTIPNYRQRMDKIKTLCIRKYKMVTRVGVRGFSVFGFYRDMPLPSLKPDWGLDLKDRPKAFTNSMHALENLLKLLE